MPPDHEMPSWEVMVMTAERLLPQVTAELTGPGSARPGTPAWRRALARADSLLRVLGGDVTESLATLLAGDDTTTTGPVSADALRGATERLRHHLWSTSPSGTYDAGLLVRRVMAATTTPPLVCGAGRGGHRFWQRELTLGLTLLRAGHEQERAWVNRLDEATADLVCALARVNPDGDLTAGGDRPDHDTLVDEAEELLCVTTVERFWIDPWLRSAVALADPECRSGDEDLFGADDDAVETGSGPGRGHAISSGAHEWYHASQPEPDEEPLVLDAYPAAVGSGPDQSPASPPHGCRPLTALLPSGARRSRGVSRRRFG